jgi:GABA permease
MWLYPWLTWVSIISIVAIVASMAVVDDEATRPYLVPSLISLAVVVAAAFVRSRRESG